MGTLLLMPEGNQLREIQEYSRRQLEKLDVIVVELLQDTDAKQPSDESETGQINKWHPA